MKPALLVAAAVLALFLWRRHRRLSKEVLGAGALATVGLVLVGSGLVHLPNIEKLIEDAGEALGPYTYVLVGVMAYLETAFFVGLVAPGEFTIMLGGVVAGQGRIDVIALLALVWFCAVAGDTTSFLLGRRLGRSFMERHGPKIGINEARLQQVERFFDRHGGKAILIGRFVGLVRAIAPFLAGASRMPYRRFAPYDIVGAGLWATAFVMLGYIFWQSFDQVAALASKGALALGVAIALVVGLVALGRQLHDREGREQVRRWLARLEAKPVIGPVVRVARPVVAPVARRVWRFLAFVWNRLTPGELGLELTTLLAVVAVGSFVFIGLDVAIHHRSATLGDVRALRIADDLRQDWLTDMAKVFTDLASLPVVAGVVALASAFLAWRRRIPEALTLLVGFLVVVLAVNVAKAAIDRPRPPMAFVATEGQSFPSGHAAYSVAYVAVAVALVRTVPWLARFAVVAVAVALAGLLGLSRMYLRAHFLSDVTAGWGLAAAIFALCAIVALVTAHLRQNGPSRSPD
jgi:membrane protein DedA with SNARE-associated domain/membrane-associated phospholipid phosphatase